MKHLILGGVRSGKSQYAETLIRSINRPVIYIATAKIYPDDEQMKLRIRQHQEFRPQHWQTIEEPIELAKVIQKVSNIDNCILVECLTLWLSNLLIDHEDMLQNQIADLLSTLSHLKGDIVFVSNEVGMGVVPMGKLSRQFVDEAGTLHQKLAKSCDQVTFITAGLATKLKG